MACTRRGTSFCSTNAAITGTGGGGPGAAFVPTQADSDITSATPAASSSTRTYVDTFLLIRYAPDAYGACCAPKHFAAAWAPFSFQFSHPAARFAPKSGLRSADRNPALLFPDKVP